MASFITAGNATNGLQVSSDNTGILELRTGTGSGTTAVTFSTGQRATFPSTISVGNTTPATTGAGITFPAAQSASSDANTLDDYEEGTFTPVIVGTTTAGTGTYSTQYGVYTKIGRTVAVRISLRWSAHTGSGTMRLNGLPFTLGGGVDEYAIPSFFIYNIALSANNVITGYIQGGATSVAMEQIATGGGTTAGVAMDTSGEFYATATYFV